MTLNYLVLTDIHRVCFRFGIDIPDWVTNGLAEEEYWVNFGKENQRYTPNHSDPSLFGLSNEFSSLKRIKFLTSKLVAARSAEDLAFKMLTKYKDDFHAKMFVDFKKIADNLSSEIENLKLNKNHKHKEIDFVALKSIPLHLVVESEGIKTLYAGGGRYKCLCPFHKEKTPSLTIFPDNHFFCFGCGVHGDAVDFIKRYNGISTISAVDKLQ